jgi:hypothetical protein
MTYVVVVRVPQGVPLTPNRKDARVYSSCHAEYLPADTVRDRNVCPVDGECHEWSRPGRANHETQRR